MNNDNNNNDPVDDRDWIRIAKCMFNAKTDKLHKTIQVKRNGSPHTIAHIAAHIKPMRHKNSPKKRKICPVHGPFEEEPQKNAWETFLDTPLHVNQPTTPTKILKTSKPMTVFFYENGESSVQYDIRTLYELLLNNVSQLIANRIQ